MKNLFSIKLIDDDGFLGTCALRAAFIVVEVEAEDAPSPLAVQADKAATADRQFAESTPIERQQVTKFCNSAAHGLEPFTASGFTRK